MRRQEPADGMLAQATMWERTIMKPFTTIAALVFALMALAHVYRIATHFQVIVGSHTIAQELSWVAVIVTAVLSYGLFREARR